MTITEPTLRQKRAHIKSSLLLGLALPIVAILIAAVVAASWRDDLPDPVAQHWDSAGNPDGFGSLNGFLAIGIISTVAFAIGCTLLSVYVSAARRMAIATAWATMGLFASVTLTALWHQRGLDDAAQATDSGWTIAVSIGAMFVAGVIGFFASPKDAHKVSDAPLPRSASGTALHVSDGERVAWHGTIGGGVTIYVGLVSVVATTFLVFAMRSWAIAIFPVLLTLVIASFSLFNVRVSDAGVEAKSVLGWPRKNIPLTTIEQASVGETNPFKDFGGWGWRAGTNNTVGIVTRKGESLLITYSEDQRFILTIDDAATAAATINGLIARDRGTQAS